MSENAGMEIQKRGLLDQMPEKIKNFLEDPVNEEEKNLWLNMLNHREKLKDIASGTGEEGQFEDILGKARASLGELNVHIVKNWQTLTPLEEDLEAFDNITEGFKLPVKGTSDYFRGRSNEEEVVMALEAIFAKTCERRILVLKVQERMKGPSIQKSLAPKELSVTRKVVKEPPLPKVPIEALRTKEEINPLDIETWEDSIEGRKIPGEFREDYNLILQKLDLLNNEELEGESGWYLAASSIFHDTYALIEKLSLNDKSKPRGLKKFKRLFEKNLKVGLDETNPEAVHFRDKHYEDFEDALRIFINVLSERFPKIVSS